MSTTLANPVPLPVTVVLIGGWRSVIASFMIISPLMCEMPTLAFTVKWSRVFYLNLFDIRHVAAHAVRIGQEGVYLFSGRLDAEFPFQLHPRPLVILRSLAPLRSLYGCRVLTSRPRALSTAAVKARLKRTPAR